MDYSKLKTVYQHLKVGKRVPSDDTYYYLECNKPENLTEFLAIKEWFSDITGNYADYSFVDLDEYYRVLYTLAMTVFEHDEFTDENLYSIEWRDDYNADRLDWLKENLTRASFYDDIKENGADGTFALIGDMQDFARAEFAQYIVNNLKDLEV